MNDHENKDDLAEKTYPMKQSAACAGSTLVTMGLLDVVAHLGPTGLLVGGLASYVAWKHGPELYAYVREKLPSPAPSDESADPQGEQAAKPVRPRGRSLLERAFEITPAEQEEQAPHEERAAEPDGVGAEDDDFWGEEEDLLFPSISDLFLFSEVTATFTPTLARIFLARTQSGKDLTCTARDLCHVALAGSTGGGKSSIMRLLLLQLCKVGVRVLLLNPHYTRYDLDTDEDWTPFEPYLVHPPMACRSYSVIEQYLKAAARDLIPRRLERRAHSQPVGKPYFIVIDELPSIVREIEGAPEYMRVILEEGRKVGIFLISAAQDFLVKTIAPKMGGGAIRECYRTAYYVGGDPTTARVLLDMPANLIPEDELGKGVVMLRSVPTRKATQVLVPYVENASLYRWLGPSTYQPMSGVGGTALAESDFRPISAMPQSGNTGNGGNDSGNGAEMALEADADKVIAGVFPVSQEAAEMGSGRSKPAISEEKLEMIRRMKEKHFQDSEIAVLVGLAGRKYGLYRQCLTYLGYAQTKEG